ncbi:MAG: pitrilysin family protein [Planctomycetota bacterium]|nr:pitrilysin family protein [Planctomycetota bacterium]
MKKITLGYFLILSVITGCGGTGGTPRAEPAKPTEIVATTTESGVTVAKLSNGLTVIVSENHNAPVVCVKAFVRAGGLYEKEWLGAGISHLCEHLVAKESTHEMPGGGAAHSPGEKRSGTLDIGGQSNAYTSLDYTCYYIAASSSKTMQCVDLIAEEVSRPDITPTDFNREHGVVQRELEMGKDDPSRQMWYAHSADIFGVHPAAVPVIGFTEPLSKLTRDDVLTYVKRMYVPQNIIFVVAGDVDTAAVLKRAAERFVHFKKGLTPDLSLPEVPPITGVRRQTVKNKSIRDVMERISFQTIPLVHDDLYALDVLSYILSQGRSSRLVRSIQFEKRLVTSIGTSSWTPAWGKGVFTVAFRAEPDKADAAEKEIFEQLRAVVADGVTETELARSRRQKLAELVYSQQKAENVSSILASDYLSTGDVDFSRNYTGKIQEVTADEILRVARKYFRFDRMVITRMVPESLRAEKATSTEKTAEKKTVTFTLPTGLRVILHPTRAVDLASMTFVTIGGLLAESEKTNGLGSLMMSLSTRGAGERTAEQIDAFFDEAGGGISGNCGNNTFYWTASVLSDRFEKALEILADVVQRPTFGAKELEDIRPLQEAAIKQVDERWTSQLMKFFRRKFFAASPYRLQTTGELDVVGSITREQIADWHAREIKADGSVLAIYGNFDAESAKAQITELFAELPKGKAAIKPVAQRKVAPEGELHVLKTKNAQAGVIVAAAGMKVTDIEDRAALTVLDTIISGYRLPSGWLHTELRGKRLVYVVHAYNWAGLLPGAFVTYAGCQPDKAPEVVTIIKKNLDRAAEYTPTQQEIDRAVNIILTADALASQSMSELSMAAALDELYGLGYDFRKQTEKLYRKITPADVRRVAKKYLSKGYVVIVTTPKPEVFGK